MKKFLQELVSKGIRCAGWKECSDARDFLIGKFQKSNVSFEYDNHDFPAWKNKKSTLKINGKTVETIPVGYSGNGKISGFLKKSRPIKTFEAYLFQRWAICDEKNRAKAYIISRPDQVWYQPLDKPTKIPYIMVEREVFRKFDEKIKIGKKISAEIEVSAENWNSKIHNLFSKTPQKKYFLISAHYDSVPLSVGANDNGTGVAVVQNIAEKFGPKDDFQYALFCAEEWNKAGSYAFVKNAKKSNLKNIKAMINIDMVGARGGTIHAIISPEFKPLLEEIQKEVDFEFNISTAIRPPFDIWPFHLHEVPIIHFGTFPYKHCHKPSDTVDKIDFRNLEWTTEIIEKVIEKFPNI